MVKTCLLLLSGGLAAQHSTLLLGVDHTSVLLVASLAMLLSSRTRPAGLFGVGFAIFMMAATAIIAERLAPELAGDSMLTRVRIDANPETTGNSVVLLVSPLADSRIPSRVRVSWFQPRVLPLLGEVWELELRLRRPRGQSNPGVFDYETWLFREAVQATGYVVGGKRNRLLWSGTASPLERIRSRFINRARLAADTELGAAVLAAVGVGERHLVSREQWHRFAVSGTSHLMAISGLHVGLAALGAFFLVYVLHGVVSRHSNSWIVALQAGVVGALLYACVAGFGVPAQRAVVMLAVAALTVVRRRQVAAPEALSLAAMIVFLCNPVATLKPGFHLSFAAVAVLLWLARRKDNGRSGRRVLRAPTQLVVMQMFLMFGLFPLTTLIFQRFAIMATPANLVAVPVFSFITVPFTLSGLALVDVHESLSVVAMRIAAYSIDAINVVIGKLVGLPFADLTLSRVGGVAWLFVLVPLLWVLLPRGWPGRWVAVLGVAAVLSWKPAPPDAGCFDAWVLDVGQGLAVVVQTQNRVLLYDTGMAWRGGGSMADQTIIPFLRSRRLDRIDWLVVSHTDLDHSGGLDTVRKAVDVGSMIVGEPGIPGAQGRCREGQSWSLDRVRVDVLHPPTGSKETGNASSCVLRISAGAHGLLLTGDIEADSERDLIQGDAMLKSSIVVVPHHGSLTSSTVPFTDSVGADFAVVSAGYANRWGFPKPRVVDRWEASGAEVLNTAADGAVGFRVCATGGIVRVTRERESRRRFWHAAT